MAHELNSDYLINLTNSNEWYNWTLAKIKKDSFGTGENSDFYALWRNADKYSNFLRKTKLPNPEKAYQYMIQMEKNLIGADTSWNNNEDRKALNSMKKMLKLWENKRHIETQKEEAERLIEEEEEKLLQIELENQRLQNEIKRKEIISIVIPEITPEITPEIVATSSILIPLGIIGLLLYSRTARK
tara:strand:+ start:96 stop:653 length:558 start_codon:yes stop_codon:yes gene_type:complete